MAPRRRSPAFPKRAVRKARQRIKHKPLVKKSKPNKKLKKPHRRVPRAKIKSKKPKSKTPKNRVRAGMRKAKQRVKKKRLVKAPQRSKKPKVRVKKKGVRAKLRRRDKKKLRANRPPRSPRQLKSITPPVRKPIAKKTKSKVPIEAEEIPVIKGSAVVQGRKLGEGGFGKVVEGIFQGRTVAVKIPLRKEDFEEALVEFKKLRNFRHRNVVEAIAYCKDPAMFVMEFMAGGTLNSWLHENNNKYAPMNWFQGLALLTDIARGVKLLHDASLLHGDLSSNNVLLARDHTTAKISDFGTVQMIEKYINASLAGQIDEAVGAFRWMAPQRLRFSKPDNYSDVWSYGCILMEFLTHPRKLPFAMAGTAQLIARLESYIEGDVRDLRIDLGEMDPDAPPVLQGLMYRCLKAKRVERPDYGHIIDELEYVHHWLVKKHNGGKGHSKTNSKRVHSLDTRTWR